MTYKKLAVSAMMMLALLTFPTGAVSAQQCAIDLDSTNTLVTAYNENVDQIPGILRGQVSDQRVDLRIDTVGGENRYAVTTDADGRITSFEEGVASDPTIRVETSESTLCSIINSDDPVTAARDAYNRGEITISGIGLVNSVVVEVVKIATRLLSGFL